MGSFSDFFENALLNHLTGKVPWTPITLFLGLCSATIDDTATGANCNELPDAGAYARTQILAVDWTLATEGYVTNNATVIFPTATAGWGVATYFALFDSGIWGAENLLMWGALLEPLTIAINDEITFSPNTLKISLD
jgi:hypothetical protein